MFLLFVFVVNFSSCFSSVKVDSLDTIIEKNEFEYGIPKGLLKSIANVESNMSAFAVNASRRTHFFKKKDEAHNFIQSKLKNGCKNISVGCLQIHYHAHKRNFSSLNDMLDPLKNVEYAAKLLSSLYKKYGSWEVAVKRYHAGSPKRNVSYCKKVMTKYKSVSPTDELNKMQ